MNGLLYHGIPVWREQFSWHQKPQLLEFASDEAGTANTRVIYRPITVKIIRFVWCCPGIYAATEAFMLTDYSPGYADTWEALGRRMQDVAQFGKLQKEVSLLFIWFCEVWRSIAAELLSNQFVIYSMYAQHSSRVHLSTDTYAQNFWTSVQERLLVIE